MRWLIVTTIGKNPGDEFIRDGIVNIICDIDPNYSFVFVDKETPDVFLEHKFDKCILAGMPVFWSFHQNNFWEIKWWKAISGYLSENKNKFMIAGAGSFQNWKNIYLGVDRNKYVFHIKNIVDRAWKVYLRDNIPNIVGGMSLDVLPCPAIFSTLKYKKTDKFKICNLMNNGSHYESFDNRESVEWRKKIKSISDIMIKNGFIFIAHNKSEEELAIKMGWGKRDIICYDGRTGSILKYYKNCCKFFGNRVHGAIVSRGVGADVLSCGFDSRQEAVVLVGGKSILPSNLDLNFLNSWSEDNSYRHLFDLNYEYEKQKNIILEFMKQ